MASNDDSEPRVVPFPSMHPGWNERDAEVLASDLSQALGCPVTMESGAGDHVLTIRANGLDALDRLCQVIMLGAAEVAKREGS